MKHCEYVAVDDFIKSIIDEAWEEFLAKVTCPPTSSEQLPENGDDLPF